MPQVKDKLMKLFIINLGLILVFCLSVFAQGTTQYVYDANGRLTNVISASGQVSVYEYDFAGNLTRVRNEQNPVLLISTFSPASGSIGSSVIIRGVGFNIIPAQNQVKFNGVSAVVSTSTLTELSVTVPIGATTGKVQVTNTIGTAISLSKFTILQGIPTISSVTPTIGKIGDAVMINGTGFSSETDENTVKFNRGNATVSNSNAYILETNVPTGGTSGKITASNDFGEAQSNTDFYVVPDNFTVSEVAQTARLNYEENYQVNIPSTKKLSLFVFEGTAGDRLYIELKNVIGNTYLKIKTPNNMLIWSWWNSADLVLPETGTYSISVESADELPLSLNLVINNGRKINPNGTPETAHFFIPGQDIEFNFQANAGQNYSLIISNATAVPANFSVVSPSNQTVYANYIDIYYTGAFASFTTSETGNYKIVYDPAGNVTGSATFKLNLLNDVIGNLVINSPLKTFTSTIPGQGFRLTFAGNQGQRFYLKTVADDFHYLNLTVKKPDGTDLITNVRIDNDSAIDINTLPVTGTYTLLIRPEFPHQSGNLQLQALDNNVHIFNNPMKNIHIYSIDPIILPGFAAGKSKAADFTLPTITYRLTANAGEQFSFATPVIIPSNLNADLLVGGTIKIYKPDGSLLTSSPINSGICNITLPVAGEYTIEVSPEGGTQDFSLKTLCGGPSS
jgi:large repetitive protein